MFEQRISECGLQLHERATEPSFLWSELVLRHESSDRRFHLSRATRLLTEYVQLRDELRDVLSKVRKFSLQKSLPRVGGEQQRVETLQEHPFDSPPEESVDVDMVLQKVKEVLVLPKSL